MNMKIVKKKVLIAGAALAILLFVQFGSVASAYTAFDFNFTVSTTAQKSGKARAVSPISAWAKPDSGNLSSTKTITVCTVDANSGSRLTKYGTMKALNKQVFYKCKTERKVL